MRMQEKIVCKYFKTKKRQKDESKVKLNVTVKAIEKFRELLCLDSKKVKIQLSEQIYLTMVVLSSTYFQVQK